MENQLEGLVALNRPPLEGEDLPLEISPPATLKKVVREPAARFARYAGYRVDDGIVTFVLMRNRAIGHDFDKDPVRVAGTFNDWQPDASWELRLEIEGDEERFTLRRPVEEVAPVEHADFKFVSRSGFWIQPYGRSPNLVYDAHGRANLRIFPQRTGHHVLRFTLGAPIDTNHTPELHWGRDGKTLALKPAPGGAFLNLCPARALGVIVEDDSTTFRLFAPRATGILLELTSPDARVKSRVALHPVGDGVWETVKPGALLNWKYQYFVDGKNHDDSTAFDPLQPILDPYARASVGPAGPGIITDGRISVHPTAAYTPPRSGDLVIVEAHLRDLLTLDPEFAGQTRPGFRELAAFIRKPDCPLRTLGVNALELLPVHENEAASPDARPPGFLWGYMPVNWFAPGSHYAQDPRRGTQEDDFGDLVKACHEAGIAVILDVVYNHAGSPNALLRIDKHHFFTESPDGELTNWSGCGNDYRADTPMGVRIIADSLAHWIRRFDVDGFRFDLAELLGTETLRELHRKISPLKQNLILIAEPWSFRGHIGGELKNSGYASWNDGYREALPHWLLGSGSSDEMFRRIIAGPGNAPHETVNYTESHDDFCWIDRITENDRNDGTNPTDNDIARTRVMFATLFASLGIPMLSAGQEFLRTKGGAHNTYLRGDRSALHLERLERFVDTREFVRGWIALRRSRLGEALRLQDAPAPGFHRAFHAENRRALAILSNAGLAAGAATPLLFAANPTHETVRIECPINELGLFRMFADDRTAGTTPLAERADGPRREGGALMLPPISSALWALA